MPSDYRPEHLFALRQSLAAFRYYQQLVLESDREIQLQLAELETAATAQPTTPPPTKATAHYARHYEPRTFDLRGELYRVFGVDLTNVPGISALTAQTILCEIGTDVSRFRNASAFASWLGLCPEKKISSGKYSSLRADEFEAAWRPPFAWELNHCITPKTTWANSSAVLPVSSAGPRRLQPQPTNLLASCSTC
jgi:hypothetical protein